MKFTSSRQFRFLTAGTLAAAAIVLALVPFNMGGCSPGNLDYGTIGQGLVQAGKASTISDKQDDAIGQSVAVQATNRWKLYPDADLNRYVTLVGRTLVASSPANKLGFPIYFAVLDTNEMNAFSGPHGYVFITRGAIAKMHDESELAGMLGHELGHIVKHHGRDAVIVAGQKQGLLTAAKGVGSVAQFGQLADLGGDVVINTGYAQPQEEQADAEAVNYVIAAGYDPNGFLHFLQRIAQEQGAGGKPFGTHPGTADRIKLVSAKIDKSGAGGQGAVLADRFQVFVKFQ